jgi:hypothetical protein
MPAQFRAAGTIHLRARKVFVIYGDVLSGAVDEGMFLEVPLNSTFSVSGRISAVEQVDLAPEQRAYVGLVMDYDDPEELGFWEVMNISNEVLEISEVEAPAALS